MEKQMEMDKAQFAEQLKNLVELGKKKKNVLEVAPSYKYQKGNRKPMAIKNGDYKIRCSFCGKTEDQVRKLIAGPDGSYICDE